jgi:hypothetical protein
MKYIYIVLIILLLPFGALAAEPQITIGQIQASGATADDEFVEILNGGDAAAAIGAWSIQYKSAAGTKYYKKNFTSGATIPSQGHYIVAGKDYAGAYDMKQSTFSLASAGGTVYVVGNQTTIQNDSDPEIVAQKTYGPEEQAPTNANANTNANAGANSNPNANDNINVNHSGNSNFNMNTDSNTNADPNANSPDDPTATNENINADQPPSENTNTNADPADTSTETNDQTATSSTAPSNTASPPPILINEFMPDPVDTPEWVELYDAADEAVDLTGWHLADGTGKNIAALSGLIFPRSFMKTELPVARLNNDGDLVIVRDPENRETDSVAYGDWESGAEDPPAPGEDQSLARRADGLDTNSDLDDFAVTTTPTPGAPNIITDPPSTDSTAAKSISATAIKTKSGGTVDTKWLADLLQTQSDQISKLLKADNIIIINNLYIGTDAPTANTAAKTAKTIKTATSATAAKKTTTAKITNGASGTIIFPPNVIAKDVFVVREAERSVEVRLALNSKLTPKVGDTVSASGTWSAAKSLPMPKLLVKTDAAMALTAGTPPEEAEIKLADAEKYLNQVVKTEGTIAEKATGKLRISEGDVSILIKTVLEANKGDRLSARGLLVKQGSDDLLIPASTADLSVIKPEETKDQTPLSKAAPYALAAGPPLVLLGAAIIGRKFKKKGGEANA